MPRLDRLLTLLFDPRGRMSRGELLVSAAVVLTIEGLLALAGADGDSTLLWLCKPLSFWIGLAALIKRLHDFGRSGWWALAGAGGLCIWTAVVAVFAFLVFGPDAFAPGSVGMIAIMGLVMLPAIGVTLWLHVAAGDAATNRFGAPSRPSEATEARPAGTASA